MNKLEKVYLVTADLHEEEYGSYIYCLGIFTDKTKAVRCGEESWSDWKLTEIYIDGANYDILSTNKPNVDKIDFADTPFLGGYSEICDADEFLQKRVIVKKEIRHDS